jgi:hypothetical protein
LSVPDMVDYLDSNGYQHHVAKVAVINADGSVTDVRRKRTIELTGDVTGKGILEDAQGVTIAVEIKDGSHRHKWGELDQVPDTASRWPSYAEVTDKPTLEQMGGYPKTGGPLDGGIDAKDAIYARTGLIARSRAGSNGGTWLGIEAPENAEPYISAKVNDESAPSKIITFGLKEIAATKDIAAPAMRIINHGGLKFCPNANLIGNSWGFGMDAANGDFGFYRFFDGTWKDTPMQFPSNGGVIFRGTVSITKEIRSANGRWRIDEDGEFYPARLNGSNMIDWCQGNFAHNSHVHNAAHGNADIVANGWGQVGTYALAGLFNSTGQLSPGALVAGSAINLCSAEGVLVGVAPSGTWKCLGYVKGDRNYGSWNVTLFIRVA